jgi:hypothetical protein
MKRVAITGASGFVGKSLQHYFEGVGIESISIPRSALSDRAELVEMIDGCEVIINLAGASIIGRWSESYKELLYHSRIDTTKALVDAMEGCSSRAELFISTSAVGIYPQDRAYTEDDTQLGDDFLANLCKSWESEALKAKELGIRTAIFRFGIVLGKDGGALSKMMTPFKLGVGGVIGDGSQAFSFIHIDDLIRAYAFVLGHNELDGVFNLTAPTPTTNRGLTKALGSHLKRPTILPLPAFVLKILLGEGASVLTEGQRVLPQRLLDSGFVFEYPTIKKAIESL